MLPPAARTAHRSRKHGRTCSTVHAPSALGPHSLRSSRRRSCNHNPFVQQPSVLGAGSRAPGGSRGSPQPSPIGSSWRAPAGSLAADLLLGDLCCHSRLQVSDHGAHACRGGRRGAKRLRVCIGEAGAGQRRRRSKGGGGAGPGLPRPCCRRPRAAGMACGAQFVCMQVGAASNCRPSRAPKPTLLRSRRRPTTAQCTHLPAQPSPPAACPGGGTAPAGRSGAWRTAYCLTATLPALGQ